GRARPADAGPLHGCPTRRMAAPGMAPRRLALGGWRGHVPAADPGLAAADAVGDSCRRRSAARRLRAEHPVRPDRAPLRHTDRTPPFAALFPRHHRRRLVAAVVAAAMGAAGVVAATAAA